MGIPKEVCDSEVLTEDEFDKRFTLVTFDEEETGDTTTDDIDVIREYPTNRVWSLVDDGDGGLCLVSGFACVNFIAWQVTNEPHPGGYCDITVEYEQMDPDEEETDEELDKLLEHVHEEEND